MAEKDGFIDTMEPEEWEETLKSEREWEELQREWAGDGWSNKGTMPPVPSL